jgi:hypothetical protein
MFYFMCVPSTEAISACDWAKRQETILSPFFAEYFKSFLLLHKCPQWTNLSISSQFFTDVFSVDNGSPNYQFNTSSTRHMNLCYNPILITCKCIPCCSTRTPEGGEGDLIKWGVLSLDITLYNVLETYCYFCRISKNFYQLHGAKITEDTICHSQCCKNLICHLTNTGLFEIIVWVLTTCHTQYTWDRSICIFLFNRTLQGYGTYLIGTLYVHPLGFYEHQHDNRVHSKLFVACQHTII